MKFKNNNDFIDLFEKRLKEYTGAKYVVLVSSCTNAIFLTLEYFKQYNVWPVQEVVIPNNTYVSVPKAILNAGFIPKFDKIKWKGSYQIGKLPLYDCAVGFVEKMYMSGTFQCLSFQQKKALPIGKGGAILLDNKDAYKILKRMAHDGRNSSISTADDLENIIPGYHMYMSPDEAAKGILLLNQYKPSKKDIGKYKEYPNISKINYETK